MTFVATVSSGGVNGTVTFSQANLGDAVAVTFSLAGPNRANASTWQLHTFRLNYDVSDRCSVAQLGARYSLLNDFRGRAFSTSPPPPSPHPRYEPRGD